MRVSNISGISSKSKFLNQTLLFVLYRIILLSFIYEGPIRLGVDIFRWGGLFRATFQHFSMSKYVENCQKMLKNVETILFYNQF